MSIGTFNLAGFFYQKGISDIRSAYDATIFALERSVSEAESDAVRVADDIRENRMPEYEWDEDGRVLYGHAEYADFKIESIRESVDLAREAYMLILYHHWEKNWLRWSRSPRYDHDKARVWSHENGVGFEDEQLNLLRKVTNYTKHHKKSLFSSHPQLFEFMYQNDGTIGDSRLKLSSEFVDSMFEALKKSGVQMIMQSPP